MPDLRLDELVETSTFRDDGTYGMTGRIIRGARVVAEHVARAWLTDRGDLVHAPNVGINLQRLQNATAGPGDFKRWEGLLVAEARAVEFVFDAAVTLTHDGRNLRVRGNLMLVDGLSYPLAVTLAEAGAALATFGGT